ncbi:P-loop containing nucleoside triphosphate hydrolase protein [Pavlovales sp. CCMP2436]|nr:P-loop containing nucleoside triphosphate hydrolase protein [Pavlovales sp. CCMP2436]
MCVLLAYGEPSLVGDAQTAGALFGHILLYGAAVFPQTYAISLAFDSPSSAQISLILMHLVAGFVLVMANLIMLSLDRTKAAAKLLVWVWRLFPPFNFGEGLLALSQAYYERLLLGRELSLFDADVLGRPMAINLILAFVFSALLLLLDSRAELGRALGRAARCWRRRRDSGAYVATAEAAVDAAERARGHEPPADDEDVAAERALVEAAAGAVAGAEDEEAVLVRSLYKVYTKRGGAAPKLAVRNLSLRVHARECFGLLGVNGAGKSTTLKILTGFHAPSAGEARVGGFDVSKQLASVYSRIGYCPQTDPLMDWLTARETLELYGALKNIAPTDVARASEALIDALGLRPHANRPTASYSGGNKRKTSLAVALLGSPAVIFLDEPSSGMDPLARRHMWDVLSRESRRRCIVLTSHAMEECEALCSRIAIIAGGRLRALGGLQRLKARFGSGYVLELKCEAGRVESVRAFVERAFGERAQLDEWHGLKLKYIMSDAAAAAGEQVTAASGGQLASIFELIEGQMAEVGIAEYAASQPTLEQVFLGLAREADDDAERTAPASPAETPAPVPDPPELAETPRGPS